MSGIKICGLTRKSDIDIVNEYMPDYIGWVFYNKSRRYIPWETAAEYRKILCPSITAVGVFVNENEETVAGLLNRDIIDMAQLHGQEDDEYIERLRRLTDKQIIKAFGIDTMQDIIMARNSRADYVLLDSKTGGTGRVFNWELIENMDRPFFLAGGLDASNVQNAVRTFNPYAVDVSSGVETDGFKDKAKIEEFIKAVKYL
ncbi:MAG: phosphoribosylanthranilate isomerase [Butyrivibrio sp.]